MKEFAEYLASKGLSDDTLKIYLGYLKKFDKGLEENELNQAYVNRFLLTHTSNSNRAFLNNLFDFLDITDLKVPKLTGRKARKKKRSLTPEDIEVLGKWLYHNKGLRYWLLLEISYHCALRRGEVLSIKVKDIGLEEWVKDTSKKCPVLIHGKGKKERIVLIPPEVMHKVISYIEKTDKDFEDRLFAFHYKAWHLAFKDAVRNTMDYNFTLHDLRRSKATEWLKNGLDLISVRNRLGHTSVKTTQLYINLDEEQELEKWQNE